MSALGNSQGYGGWIGDAAVRDASGTIHMYRRLRVQVQLVREDDSPWSDWISEYAVIRQVALTRAGGGGLYSSSLNSQLLRVCRGFRVMESGRNCT